MGESNKSHRLGFHDFSSGDLMELRCPKCNSADLKKVPLAYEEGSFQGEAQTHFRAAVFGASGADLIMGRASTRVSHQSALSKRLTPPVKWSYRKVIFWSALVLLCGGWVVFYLTEGPRDLRNLDPVEVSMHGCSCKGINRRVESRTGISFDNLCTV